MQNDIVKQPDQKPENVVPKVDVVTSNRPPEVQKLQPQDQTVQSNKSAPKNTPSPEDDEIKPQSKKAEHQNQKQQTNAQGSKNSSDKPIAVISVAIIICLAMIGLVVYSQLSSN